MKIFVLILIILFIFIFVLVAKYNKMVRYRNKVDESLKLIDIHLKLRFDLIPNLVNIVKGYTKHEKEIVSKLAEMRKIAVESKTEEEKLEYANQMVPQMRQVIAVAESYPEIKADKLFKNLMEELVLVEDKIAASRRFYDSNVSEYNSLIQVFPNSIVASMFKFKKCELLKIDVGERLDVHVDLGANNDDK